MATSTLKSNIKKGNITVASGFTANEINVTQVGSLVCVSGYFSKSGGIGTSEVLVGTISRVDLPSAVLRSICGGGSQPYLPQEIAYLAINTSGEIRIKLNTSRLYVILDVVYGV